MLISALGVYVHQLWLMWLGSGVIGGIGLGLGYISPVSTLIKWFPDRRGMATGMAIMGFGGGAMIGAPLADILMTYFRDQASVGVWQTFVTLAAIYFVFMLGGAFGYRVPPANWRPDGWTPPPESRSMITQHQVNLRDAHKTRSFWMIWLVLCLNVSAGIGVIGMASPMLQEIFGGSLIGLPDIGFAQLDLDQKRTIAAIAAGFTGLLSLFNIGGRFFWASISDHIGRKKTYYLFFLLGIALYALAPTAAHIGSKALFVLMFGVILSMYGGGFATVPAYLADIFGTQFVGAIHGRLLTAWSTAGIIGPVIVNYIREYEKSIGVPERQALRRHDVRAGGAARARPDRQLAGPAVGGAAGTCNPRKWRPCSRAPRHSRSPAPSGSDAAASMARHSSPGCSWACRSPGACGSRCPRPPSCSTRRG